MKISILAFLFCLIGFVSKAQLNAYAIDPTCNGEADGQIVIGVGFSGGYQVHINGGLVINGTPGGWPLNNSLTFPGYAAGTYTVSFTDFCTNFQSVIVTVTDPPKLSFSSTVSNPTCQNNDGVISVMASGGIAPYLYQLNSNSVSSITTNLSAGNYSINVIDSYGCNLDTSFVLTYSSPYTLTSSVLQDCNLGSNSVNLSLTGSPALPVAYSTNPGNFSSTSFSNLATGVYTVSTTDANNCVSTEIFSVGIGKIDIVNISSNCTSSIDLLSGASSFSINGSSISGNTIVGNVGSSYTIVGTDSNGCPINKIHIPKDNNPIKFTVSNIAKDSCGLSKGALCINASGGALPYTYKVNGTLGQSCFSGLHQGNYTVIVIDANSCSFADTLIIPYYNPLSLSVAVQEFWCTQGNAIATASVNGPAVNPITYFNSYDSSTINTFTSTNGGDYIMSATDGSGCQTSSIVLMRKVDSLRATISFGSVCGNDTLKVGSNSCYVATYSVDPTPNGFYSNQDFGLVIPTTSTYTIVSALSGLYCNDTTYVTLLPNIPSATIISLSNINPSCLNSNDGSITAVANPFEPNAIHSLINANNSLLQQSTSSLFNNLGPGTYSINVRDSSGCNQLSTTLTSLNSNCGNISGQIVHDSNSNCNLDIGEATIANRMVILNPGNNITYSDVNGNYVFPSLSYGNYTIQTNAAPGYIPICSATSAAVVSNTNSNIVINRYDSIAPLVNYSIWSWGGCLSPALAVWNPNFLKRNINYSLYHTPNIGGNARIYAVFDSVQYFGSSLPAHSGISGDTVYWDLPIGSNGNIEVTFSYPPNTQAGPGQNINYYVTQHPLDSNLANNFSPTTITICTSYDPNDKQVNPEGATSNGFTALNDSVLNYKVRFQNTGNAPAGNVIIRDTLDSDLDITSFSVISASHSYQIEVEQNHILVFKFLGIMLPDSASDQEGSNGYIAYTIKKKPGTLPGDIVSNTAHIYFDYNAPIVTNTTTNTYYESIKNASTQITKNTNCSNVCGNGSVLINAQGGAGTLTYSILPNCATTLVSGNLIAPLPSGNFTVQVKDQAGNIENLPITIGSPTPINLSINTTNASGANGGSAQANVSGGTAPFTYNWSASGCSGATCNNLNVGTYTLSILDAEGCGTSSNFTISYPTSVQQINFENSIQLFPNPTKDILFVTSTNNLGSISISNQMGQIIWSANLNTNETQISTAGWANGVYYLRNRGSVYKVSVQD